MSSDKTISICEPDDEAIVNINGTDKSVTVAELVEVYLKSKETKATIKPQEVVSESNNKNNGNLSPRYGGSIALVDCCGTMRYYHPEYGYDMEYGPA